MCLIYYAKLKQFLIYPLCSCSVLLHVSLSYFTLGNFWATLKRYSLWSFMQIDVCWYVMYKSDAFFGTYDFFLANHMQK